jgi:hypothetical protein
MAGHDRPCAAQHRHRSVYIGTGNGAWSYFNNTVDASVFVHDGGPARTLTQIFDRDWNGSYVTTLDAGKDYPAPRNHWKKTCPGTVAVPGTWPLLLMNEA